MNKNNDSSKTAFIAMPFTEKTGQFPEAFYDEVLKNLITPAANEAGFKVKTAKRPGSDIIQSTILQGVFESDLLICDLTSHNPNVLFELGLRVAKELPVALIRAHETKSIFDVDNMIRVYEYNPNLWKSTLNSDVPKLSDHISHSWQNHKNQKSYLSILQNS